MQHNHCPICLNDMPSMNWIHSKDNLPIIFACESCANIGNQIIQNESDLDNMSSYNLASELYGRIRNTIKGIHTIGS